MRLLLACFLWFMVSLHVVGGAAWFNRRFPRESAWFGFLLPALGLVCVLNFLEHMVGMPSLLWLLPVTALFSAWQIVHPQTNWKALRLPMGIFLVAFAFTLALRALKPGILAVSSGTYDLSLVSSFCLGEKLPPAYIWFPPHHIGQYYTFLHYAASVLTRLLNLDIGTGFNVSSALLSAWICFAFAGIAWTVSRHRVWITIAAAVMAQCAANGCSAYMYLTTPNLDLIVTSCLFIGQDDPGNFNPLVHALEKVDIYERRELEIPGFWSWLGTYHGTCGGQLLTLLSVWCLVELLRRRPTNWPWIGLVATPAVMMITSTWGVPMTGVILIAGLAAAWYLGLAPKSFRFVFMGLATVAILLGPTFIDFLPTAIYYFQDPITKSTHTQVLEFAVYWWPIYLPLLAAVFLWRRLSPAAKIICLLTPVFFIAVESVTFGVRIDMTGKLWGFIWGIAWCILFPVIARQRGYGYRMLFGVLALSGLISFWSWCDWTYRTTLWNDEVLQLEGIGVLRSNPVKAKIFNTISLLKSGQIIQPGKPCWNCPDNGAMTCFTKNYAYIDGCFYIDNTFCPSQEKHAARRDAEMRELYEGKSPDAYLYLRQHKIAALVIWPDDLTPDDVVASLKKQLSPTYEYVDYREGIAPNAGVFVFCPWLEDKKMVTVPAPVIVGPPDPGPKAKP